MVSSLNMFEINPIWRTLRKFKIQRYTNIARSNSVCSYQMYASVCTGCFEHIYIFMLFFFPTILFFGDGDLFCSLFKIFFSGSNFGNLNGNCYMSITDSNSGQNYNLIEAKLTRNKEMKK